MRKACILLVNKQDASRRRGFTAPVPENLSLLDVAFVVAASLQEVGSVVQSVDDSYEDYVRVDANDTVAILYWHKTN
jgi:hypothetical protein